MTLPLYRLPSPYPEDKGNAGLKYSKFCDLWRDDVSDMWTLAAPKSDARAKIEPPKSRWISKMTRCSVGDLRLIDEYSSRLRALVRAQGGLTECVRTESRMVTGLGLSHPVEAGFAWHPNLGTPFIPGSSIKGLALAWARGWWEVPSQHSQTREVTLDRLFGTIGKAGGLVFFDALPTSPVRLRQDVMTPHYGRYYMEGETPGDWHSPIPVYFLVVDADQEFTISVAPSNTGQLASEDLALAMSWLKDALTHLGAGAKTSTGYGRFAPVRAQP